MAGPESVKEASLKAYAQGFDTDRPELVADPSLPNPNPNPNPNPDPDPRPDPNPNPNPDPDPDPDLNPNSDPNPTPQVADPSLLALIESLLVQAPERRLGVRGSASDIRAITSHAYF